MDSVTTFFVASTWKLFPKELGCELANTFGVGILADLRRVTIHTFRMQRIHHSTRFACNASTVGARLPLS
jgi:hypothetical protein